MTLSVEEWKEHLRELRAPDAARVILDEYADRKGYVQSHSQCDIQSLANALQAFASLM